MTININRLHCFHQTTNVVAAIGTLALFAMTAPMAADNASCDRACLETFVGDYATALVKHDPAGLT